MDSSRAPKEKLSASLSAVIFFIPLLMEVKTPFVVKYMKQGFIINLAEMVLALIASIFWGFMGIVSLLNFVCIVTALFLAYNAFLGKEWNIAFLLENADKIIQNLNIGKWFSTK